MHALRLLDGLAGRAFSPGGVRPHFEFECNGRRIIYAYIYKNACSAFKNFIVESSPHRGRAELAREERVGFLIDHHLVRNEAERRPGDVRLFVYRDPLQRFTSAYLNKFVMRDGHADLFANVAQLTGRDPAELSARELATEVLVPHLRTGRKAGWTRLDHHFTAQSDCLAHMRYDLAVPIGQLLPTMRTLVGRDLADRYFASPVNRSAGVAYDESVADVPAEVLRRRYLASGELPRSDALLTPELRLLVARLYRHDIALVRRLARSARAA